MLAPSRPLALVFALALALSLAGLAAGPVAADTSLPGYFRTATYSTSPLTMPHGHHLVVLCKTAQGNYAKFHATGMRSSGTGKINLWLTRITTYTPDGRRISTGGAVTLAGGQTADLDQGRVTSTLTHSDCRLRAATSGGPVLEPLPGAAVFLALDFHALTRGHAAAASPSEGHLLYETLDDTVVAVKTSEGRFGMLHVATEPPNLRIVRGIVWAPNGTVHSSHRGRVLTAKGNAGIDPVRGGTGRPPYRIVKSNSIDLDPAPRDPGPGRVDLALIFHQGFNRWILKPDSGAAIAIYRRYATPAGEPPTPNPTARDGLPGYFNGVPYSGGTIPIAKLGYAVVVARTNAGNYCKFHANANEAQRTLTIRRMITYKPNGGVRGQKKTAFTIGRAETFDLDGGGRNPAGEIADFKWWVNPNGPGALLTPRPGASFFLAFDFEALALVHAIRAPPGPSAIPASDLVDTVLFVRTQAGNDVKLIVAASPPGFLVRRYVVWDRSGGAAFRRDDSRLTGAGGFDLDPPRRGQARVFDVTWGRDPRGRWILRAAPGARVTVHRKF